MAKEVKYIEPVALKSLIEGYALDPFQTLSCCVTLVLHDGGKQGPELVREIDDNRRAR